MRSGSCPVRVRRGRPPSARGRGLADADGHASGSVTVEPDADARLAEDAACGSRPPAVLVDRHAATSRVCDSVCSRSCGCTGRTSRCWRPRTTEHPAPSAGRHTGRGPGAAGGEGALQRTLATAAVDAQSGALARLLASVSASVAQHLTSCRCPVDEARDDRGRRPAGRCWPTSTPRSTSRRARGPHLRVGGPGAVPDAPGRPTTRTGAGATC